MSSGSNILIWQRLLGFVHCMAIYAINYCPFLHKYCRCHHVIKFDIFVHEYGFLLCAKLYRTKSVRFMDSPHDPQMCSHFTLWVPSKFNMLSTVRSSLKLNFYEQNVFFIKKEIQINACYFLVILGQVLRVPGEDGECGALMPWWPTPALHHLSSAKGYS